MTERYPEHDKLKVIKKNSQCIGGFLEWLKYERNPRIELCVRNYDSDDLDPCFLKTEQLLAEFFQIDLKKIEEEKLQMLEQLRKSHEKTSK